MNDDDRKTVMEGAKAAEKLAELHREFEEPYQSQAAYRLATRLRDVAERMGNDLAAAEQALADARQRLSDHEAQMAENAYNSRPPDTPTQAQTAEYLRRVESLGDIRKFLPEKKLTLP